MKILHFLFRGIAYILGHLPFFLLYLKSDFIGFMLFHVIRYRRKVVSTNLRNSFPDKSAKELKKISRDYYRNLGDLIVEIIRLRGITPEELTERVVFKDYEVLQAVLDKGKSVLLITGHIGNWEWLGVRLSLCKGFDPCALVKPLSDPFFHNYINQLRSKYSPNGLIDFRSAFRELVRRRKSLTVTLIAGDQTPAKDEINFWTPFLNQDTPVFLGTEKIARSLDMAVIFLTNTRISRGHYEARFELITDDAASMPENEITLQHVRKLDDYIRSHPDNWLWSHRRWKYKRSAENS